MNVKQLRSLLKSRGLKIPRLKADMINVILQDQEKLSLQNLPTELIYNICNQMNTPALGNFAQTNKEYNQICSDVLSNRDLKFENLFTYKSRSSTGDCDAFTDCILLKDIGNQKAGTHIDAICAQVQLLMWNGNDLVEDEVVDL